MIKQITVFIENKPGRLKEVTRCLADEQINMHALCVADTTNFSILRMVVSDPVKAESVLKEKGLMVKTTDVIAVATGHKPGSLHSVLQSLKDADIAIEYMYAFTSLHKDHDALIILRLENQEAALDKLKGGEVAILGQAFLDQLNEI